ncbi:inositol monophosphatase family protein [Candidatus Poriferisocius sp.]|uniref:inositol monophosphatase family protein n=1 Tax=Candidatus Poriferisocius sp. TaxID=3101276 RepID=UPI003B5CBAC7
MTDTGSPPPVNQELLDEAVHLTREAGRLTLRWFADHELSVRRKDDGSPVTDADQAAETFLREELATRFPDDAIVGEEFADQQGSSDRTWIIDPIDGTRSFVRGVPLYTTLLAMFDGHGPAAGVVAVPGLDEAVWAGRQRGCFHNGRRCRVSTQSDLGRSYVSASGFEWWPDGAFDRVRHREPRMRTWGDGYGYVLVATGRVEAMVDPGLNLWDIAPMLVVIPEAGGRITTWSGGTDAGAGDWLATNGALHSELLSLLSPPPSDLTG